MVDDSESDPSVRTLHLTGGESDYDRLLATAGAVDRDEDPEPFLSRSFEALDDTPSRARPHERRPPPDDRAGIARQYPRDGTTRRARCQLILQREVPFLDKCQTFDYVSDADMSREGRSR